MRQLVCECKTEVVTARRLKKRVRYHHCVTAARAQRDRHTRPARNEHLRAAAGAQPENGAELVYDDADLRSRVACRQRPALCLLPPRTQERSGHTRTSAYQHCCTHQQRGRRQRELQRRTRRDVPGELGRHNLGQQCAGARKQRQTDVRPINQAQHRLGQPQTPQPATRPRGDTRKRRAHHRHYAEGDDSVPESSPHQVHPRLRKAHFLSPLESNSSTRRLRSSSSSGLTSASSAR
ncbi:MAG: hypothetical protein BWY85_01042 [Firmicutes bacterium ADurb.Bin506]|nr:MAG: hypothetical protein BWY85_01042 [Firmicutes bacterium ADurb.Bin506]